MAQPSPILDVDLPAFESGDAATRAAVVDGTMRSLATGFVYVRHDLSEDLLDDAYGRLAAFFSLPQDRKDRCTVPGSNGQTGYTGLLVETAAVSEVPDFKEMLNWSLPVPAGHPLRLRYPHRYGDPTLPDEDLPGTTEVLMAFHHTILDRSVGYCGSWPLGWAWTRATSTSCSGTGRPSPGPFTTRRWIWLPATSTSGRPSTATST